MDGLIFYEIVQMFTLKGNLKFININQDYLKYLHDACPEIYYKPNGYDKKPYLGILLNKDGREYVIPLSSAKEKHKIWKNVESDRFLIYENCKQMRTGKVIKFCADFKLLEQKCDEWHYGMNNVWRKQCNRHDHKNCTSSQAQV